MKRRWILLILLATVLQLWAQSDTTQVSEQWSYGTTIGQEDMNNRDQSSNAIDAIRGRVAGMTVDQSGENGTSATLETLDVFGYKTPQQDPRFDLYFYYDTVWVDGQMIYREDGKTPLVYEADKVAMNVSGTTYEKTAGARLNKYEHDPNGIQDCNVGKNDIVLFRYADAVLMKAEAKLRKGQSAYTEIKAVRDRVGASEIAAPTLNDIYEERWRELMWEGWHRNDMIRFGKWTGHTTIFPIPQDMLLIHKDWKQNEGY